MAVLVSAVRASDSQRETQRAAFHARAARGRPEPVDASGVSTSLNYDGQQYALHGVPDRAAHLPRSIPGTPWPRSQSTGPTTSSGPSRPQAARATSSSPRTGPAACWRSTASPTGSTATRASPCARSGRRSSSPSPSAPGQDVAEGDPIVVAEAMKMESTLRAPFAGTITSVAGAAQRAGGRRRSAGPDPPGDPRGRGEHRPADQRLTRQLRRDGPCRHLRPPPVRAGVRRPARLPAGLRARPRRPLRAAGRAALVRQPRQRRRHQAAGCRGRLPGPVHRPGPALAVRA